MYLLKREVNVPKDRTVEAYALFLLRAIVAFTVASMLFVGFNAYVRYRAVSAAPMACGISAPVDCVVTVVDAFVPAAAPVYLAPPALERVEAPSYEGCAITHDVTRIEVLGRTEIDQPADFMVPVTVYRCPESESADRLYWHRAGATDRSFATIPADARVDYITAGGIVELH